VKYLFINSVAGVGSTGRIAADKCRELMAAGHECRLAYGRTCANCDDVPTIRIGTDLDFKLHGVMTRVFDNHGFASAAATKKFLNAVREYDPDVIWLHNIHGYYIHVGMLFDYLRFCGKRIFWTLHDCWSFTGHCAYFDFAGCEKWKTGCEKCPQKKSYPASMLMDNSQENYASKKYCFTGIPNLTLIVPSKWLAGLLQESNVDATPDVLKFVVGDDAETTKANIDSFVKIIEAAVKKAEVARATGTTPRTITNNGNAMTEIDKRIAKYS
jgi:hypothetical protein